MLGATAALAFVGGGSLAYGSVAGLGDAKVAAAEAVGQPGLPPLPPQAAMELVAMHQDAAELADQHVDASRASHLMRSASVDADRAAAAAAADQAAKAAAEAVAKAAADAAAAEAQRQADADRAARDAQRQAVVASAQADPKSAAKAMLGDFGFSASQFSCLDSLWTRESGWSVSATNRSSGAYGIPQSLPASKMASAGADYRTNPATQIKWGLQYIKDTYGSPCSAWGHSQATGWY